jgi:hypothetical protein
MLAMASFLVFVCGHACGLNIIHGLTTLYLWNASLLRDPIPARIWKALGQNAPDSIGIQLKRPTNLLHKDSCLSNQVGSSLGHNAGHFDGTPKSITFRITYPW